MIKTYKISENRLVKSERDDSDVFVYVNPDAAEKRILLDKYRLDEHTLNSALDPDELSRLEFEPDHIALIVKRPKNYSSADEFLFRIASYGLFWFKNCIILVISDDIPMFDGKSFNRVTALNEIVLKTIYNTISHYLEHLKVINMISDSLEDKINTSMKNKYLINLFTLEKSLVYYLNALNSNSFVIERIKHNAAKIGLSVEETEMVDDIVIENNQCYKQAEIYSNILAGLMDARVSIVSNNLNILMKTLNIITIGIMVPTFVVSAFSMNVDIPLASHPHAFWIVIALAVMSVVSFMTFWKFKKW
jgi:magnesium transporter